MSKLSWFILKKGREKDDLDTRRDVELMSTDSPWERSRKLFKIIGLVDRDGLADKMAEGIHSYMQLDSLRKRSEDVTDES